MNRHLHPLFYSLLLAAAVFTACHGQTENGLPKADAPATETAPAAQPKLLKTQGTDKYDQVRCGIQDKAGNMWFGTSGEGVYRYDGRSFTNFTTKDGLSSNTVWSILEDTSGSIWFGTDNGLCRYDGKTLTRVAIPGTNGSLLYLSPMEDIET